MTDLATMVVSFIDAERLTHALECDLAMVTDDVVKKRAECIPRHRLDGEPDHVVDPAILDSAYGVTGLARGPYAEVLI
jgi:hypothetical protein